ncbi:MAG: hypothetical protein RLZZ359_1053 [Actinomycetota bacterium]
MSRYRIMHTTGFKYPGMVAASYNEARMSPVRDESQFVLSSKIDIQPHTSGHEYYDYFNSRVSVFEVLEPHDELQISASSIVEVRPKSESLPDFDWQQLGEAIPRSLSLTDAAAQTKRTTPSADLARFAKKTAAAANPHQTAIAICKKIFADLTYKNGHTGVHSIASEAWAAKVGVCQDYAHIAIGALRSAGIPARYVSGYLHPSREPKLHEKVAGESHAWVEWWAGAWFAYDPTNDIIAGDRHIVVGRGRDYDDVPPLRGVYAGPFDGELFVKVEITKEG